MDKNLKVVIKEIKKLSDEEKISLALASIKGLLPEITAHFDDTQASVIIASIFSTAAAADGKLDLREFSLIKAFVAGPGVKISDEDLIKMIAGMSNKDAFQAIHALNHILSLEGRASLISLVAAICAIDGKMDSNEIQYLSDLYEG